METQQPTRVWIVEDDRDYRQSVCRALETQPGARCTDRFGACETALAAARTLAPDAAPDVLLLDINLPGMSGLDALAPFKAYLPATRIVMLTNRDDASTIYQALRAGAAGYLLKSADVDDIVAGVAQARRGGMLMPAPVAREVQSFLQAATLPAPQPDHGLSEREMEVLVDMGQGFSQKEIATRLSLSPHTVDTHIRHIYDKLHVRSGVEAVAKALREKLIR